MNAINRLRAAHTRRPPVLNLELLEDRNLLSVSTATFDSLQFDLQRFDPNHIVVGLGARTALADLSAVASGLVRFDTALDLGDQMFRLELQPGQTVDNALAFFRLVPNVRFAQADYQVSLTAVPNDPSFSSQYGLNLIGAPTAWNTTTGSGRTIVAVIDTGVDYTHPDLAANIWTNTREIAGNGRDDDGNGFIDDIRGWDFANNDNNPMDDNGHGTHVAGIIGAVGNNAIGVSGVNWRVQIMPVKFLSASGSGYMSNAIRALNYAVANGATVSNNSYGGGGFYQAFYDAINNARARGHIFVAAAGNNSTNSDTSPQYPAGYGLDNVVSVAATDSLDRLASFSNYGATSVDLGAPGVNIYSTLNGGRYTNMSGTSMASPFVAGAIALVRDFHPEWTYRQVIQQVLSTTDPLASLAGKTVSGGRLNLARALGASGGGTGGSTSGAVVSSATFSGSTAGSFNKVRVTFNKAMNGTTFTAADIVGLTRNGAAVSGLTYTVAPVAGTNNQFDVRFTAQSAAGTYQLTFGPDIRDTSGVMMNQNGNATNGETPGDRYTAVGQIGGTFTFNSTDVPKGIYDGLRTISVLNVNQDLTIARLTVKAGITHSYDSDLRIYLKGPDGTVINLFNRRGGGGDNIGATFVDQATTAIASGVAPFGGSFRPEQALAAFNGKNARGQWQLIVDDVALFDQGQINSWSITVETSGGSAASRSIDGNSDSSGFSTVKSLPQIAGTQVVAAPYWIGSTTQIHRQEATHRNDFADFILQNRNLPSADWLQDDQHDVSEATSVREWLGSSIDGDDSTTDRCDFDATATEQLQSELPQ